MNRRIRPHPGAALTKSALDLLAAMAMTSVRAPAAWAEDGHPQIVYRCP